ncbi:MAG: hypothetical protein AAGH60_09750 [Pseudomonadota bacterium]
MPTPTEDNVELLSSEEANAALNKPAIFNFLSNYIDHAFADAGPMPPYLVFEVTSYLQQATDLPSPPPPHLVDMMFDHMLEMAQPVEGMPQFAEIADWVRTTMFDTLFDVELIPLDPGGVILFTNALAKRSFGEVLKDILEALKRLVETVKRLDMPSNWDLVARAFRRTGPFRLLATDSMIIHRSVAANILRPAPDTISTFVFKEKLRAPEGAVMVTPNFTGQTQFLSEKRLPESLTIPPAFGFSQTNRYSGGSVRVLTKYSSLLSRDAELEFIVLDSFGNKVQEPDKLFLSFVYDMRVEYWGFENS